MEKRNKKAFTIIELIVVIVILGILVLLGMPKFIGHVDKANMTKHFTNVKSLEDGIERFVLDNGRFPRLTNIAYTKEEIKAYSVKLKDKTGKDVEIDENGNYYDIDYLALVKYVKIKESDRPSYILQNPVGKVFYLDKPTGEAKVRADYTVSNPVTIPDGKEEIVTEKGIYTDEEVEVLVTQGYIKISTPEELNDIRKNLSGKYIQTKNIDLTGYGNSDDKGWTFFCFISYIKAVSQEC